MSSGFAHLLKRTAAVLSEIIPLNKSGVWLRSLCCAAALIAHSICSSVILVFIPSLFLWRCDTNLLMLITFTNSLVNSIRIYFLRHFVPSLPLLCVLALQLEITQQFLQAGEFL